MLGPEILKNRALTNSAVQFDPQIRQRLMTPGRLMDPDAKMLPPMTEVRPDGTAIVRYYDPNAGKVTLRNIFEEIPMERDESGVWSAAMPAGSVGLRPVSVSVDGTPVLSDLIQTGYGSSRLTNFVDIPAEGEDFWLIKDVPHGGVTREFYFSTATGNYESCLVYTPPGYMSGTERYPVLYLQHGHGENESCWTYQGKVNFIMDNLLAEGKAVPCLIVMNNGMVQKEDASGVAQIRPELFEKLLLEDCIPHIEKTYRCLTDRDHRAMAGLSMGSMQTSVVTLRHQDLFAWAGLFSCFLHAKMLLGGTEEHLAALDDRQAIMKNYRLFFRGWGEEDHFAREFLGDDALLEEKGLSPKDWPAHRRILYSGAHEWSVWRKCARDFLQLVFQ